MRKTLFPMLFVGILLLSLSVVCAKTNKNIACTERDFTTATFKLPNDLYIDLRYCIYPSQNIYTVSFLDQQNDHYNELNIYDSDLDGAIDGINSELDMKQHEVFLPSLGKTQKLWLGEDEIKIYRLQDNGALVGKKYENVWGLSSKPRQTRNLSDEETKTYYGTAQFLYDQIYSLILQNLQKQ